MEQKTRSLFLLSSPPPPSGGGVYPHPPILFESYSLLSSSVPEDAFLLDLICHSDAVPSFSAPMKTHQYANLAEAFLCHFAFSFLLSVFLTTFSKRSILSSLVFSQSLFLSLNWSPLYPISVHSSSAHSAGHLPLSAQLSFHLFDLCYGCKAAENFHLFSEYLGNIPNWKFSLGIWEFIGIIRN